jgi:hypothetical protein
LCFGGFCGLLTLCEPCPHQSQIQNPILFGPSAKAMSPRGPRSRRPNHPAVVFCRNAPLAVAKVRVRLHSSVEAGAARFPVRALPRSRTRNRVAAAVQRPPQYWHLHLPIQCRSGTRHSVCTRDSSTQQMRPGSRYTRPKIASCCLRRARIRRLPGKGLDWVQQPALGFAGTKVCSQFDGVDRKPC